MALVVILAGRSARPRGPRCRSEPRSARPRAGVVDDLQRDGTTERVLHAAVDSAAFVLELLFTSNLEKEISFYLK